MNVTEFHFQLFILVKIKWSAYVGRTSFEESVGSTLSQNFFEFIDLKFNYRDRGS
jgi:hypothetical protein